MHILPEGNSRAECQELINNLRLHKRIDFQVLKTKADSRCATSYLFGPARGKMFGVMECIRPDGSPTFLYGFSGQYNGLWEIEGWVPPIFKVKIWEQTNSPIEKRIKQLGQRIDNLPTASEKRKPLLLQRKQLSQELMKKLHSLYTLRNFRGNFSPLAMAFLERTGMPTGTGDCCAPKLLNFAILNNFYPVSISEFFWGKENKSETKHHGQIYPSCSDKCEPILGFMLCGLEQKSRR